MNPSMFDNEDVSILTDSTTEDMEIEELSEMDTLDEMDMVPFTVSSVPIQPLLMNSDLNIPMYNMDMQQMPMYGVNEMNYSEPYMYNYTQDNYMESENELPDYADITMEHMMDPWQPMTDDIYQMDNMGQIEDMNYSNNLEDNDEYNIENQENPRGSLDYENTRVHSDINEILRMIENFNPEVIDNLMIYGIPYNTAQKMVRKIIPLTLNYYK